MNDMLRRLSMTFVERRRRHKRWVNCVVSISLIVALLTGYILIKPSIAVEKSLICGMEEHIHNENCYDGEGGLICDALEHTHSDDCYEIEENILAEGSFEDAAYVEETIEETTDEAAEFVETTEEVTESLFEDIENETHGELTEDTVIEREFGSNGENFEQNTGTGGSSSEYGDDFDMENDEESQDTDNIEDYIIYDEALSDGGLIAEDNVSGGGLVIETKEEKTEEAAEELTETTTEAIQEAVMLAMAPVSESGTAGTVNWSLYLNASGAYTLSFTGSGIIPNNFCQSYLSKYADIIEKINIAAGFSQIGEFAFKELPALTTVEFEDNTTLTTIDKGAFYGCANLTAINLESCNSLATIGARDRDSTDTTSLFYDEGAFANTALTSVTIPDTIRTIDHCAFYNCTALKEVIFERDESNSRKILRSAIFAGCSSLESVNLEDVTGLITTVKSNKAAGHILYDESCCMFADCTSLKSLIIPSGFGYAYKSLKGFCAGCSNLESLVFMSNERITGEYDAIVNIVNNDVTKLKVLDLSPLSSLIKTGNYAIRGGMERVIFPSSIKTINTGAISDDKGISYIEFTKGDDGLSNLTTINNQAFQRSNIIEADFSDTRLTTVENNAFENSSKLTKVVLPKTMNMLGSSVFYNCSAISEFVYDCQKLSTCRDNVFENASDKIAFTFGKNVDSIPYYFVKSMQGHIGSFAFEGPNEFELAYGLYSSSDFTAPLNKAGKYIVDENGNLYYIESNSAVLVQANKAQQGTFTVPVAVAGTDGTEYIVTGIGSNAFKDSYFSAITFTMPESIVTVEDRAFADANMLAKINDKAEAEEIKKSFANCTYFGADIFAATLISQKEFENGTVDTDKNLRQNNLQLSTASYEKLTGETNLLTINLSEGNDNKKYRIYFKCNDGCIYPDVFDLDSSKVNVKKSDTEGIYYYDLPARDAGSTGAVNIGFSYPNLFAPGNKVQIWSVEGTEESLSALGSGVIKPGETADDNGNTPSTEYFETVWNTEPLAFDVEKELNGNITPHFKAGSDGATVVDNLSYTIKLSALSGQEVNVGSDRVKYVEYEDVLTLPNEITWRDGLDPDNTRYTVSADGKTGILYATIGEKDYVVCSVVLDTEKIENLRIYKNSEGKYVVCWRAVNRDITSEISLANTILAFGGEILTANGVNESTDYTISNNVTADTYYCFSEKKSDSDSASSNLGSGSGSLIMDKQLVNAAEYWGEEVEYLITVENPSAFSYTDGIKIWDDLGKANTTQYLTAESMEEMFSGGVDDPQYLKITIDKAVLVKNPTGSVTAIDGSSNAVVSKEDTGAELDGHYSGPSILNNSSYISKTDASVISDNAVISIYLNDKKQVVVEAEYGTETFTRTVGEGFSSIQAALDDLGYMVTQKDYYKMVWEYPEDYNFNAGVKKQYAFTAKVKNTFQYLEGDQYFFWGYPGENINQPIVNNTAYMTDVNDNKIGDDHTTEEKRPKIDMSMSKFAECDGEDINEESVLQDGNIIDYTLKMAHYGSCQYELLPVVDHMDGMQVLLADYDKNSGADWVNEATVYTHADGSKYYVLNNEGTYKGVWLNGYYADSVTVERSEGGLNTLIKWYYKNTPQKDWNYGIEYKSLISQEFAGNENTAKRFSVSNEFWVNDHPTHRLWDFVGTSGAAIGFTKNIVTEEANDPDNDGLVKSSSITRDENIVEYRLEFYDIGSKQITLNGSDFYDALPLTDDGGGNRIFEWSKANVSLKYKCTDGVDVKYNETYLNNKAGGEEWSITDVNPHSESDSADTKQQQYIVWNNNFNINFAENSGGRAYIYVTLTFPNDINDNATGTWNKYIAAKGSEVLQNTLYTYNMPAVVTHNLSEPGKVLLQKGVYETGYYAHPIPDGNYVSYYRGSDRYHYGSNSENNPFTKQVVIYYITLRNSGTTRLYLSPIYDVLPEGFEFVKFASVVNAGQSAYAAGACPCVSKTSTPIKTEYAPTVTTINNSSLLNINITIDGNEDLGNGHKRLKFGFADGTSNESTRADLQTDNNMPYLNPGQYIQFGYTCYTSDYTLNANEAVNTAAMEYIDLDKNGVTADNKTDVIVSSFNGFGNNDGGRSVITNGEAKALGFTETNENNPVEDVNRQWLVSDVKVIKSNMVPGITKTVEKPMVKYDEAVNWTVLAHSNGTEPIVDYTIEETMEKPYKFQGDVRYGIYSNSKLTNSHWHYSSNGYNPDGGLELLRCFGWGTWGDSNTNASMFRIEERSENDAEVKIHTNQNADYTLEINNESGATFEINAYMDNRNAGDYLADWISKMNSAYKTNATRRINVALLRDDDGNETLRIRFLDPIWTIPSDGYGKLELSTVRVPAEKDNNTYVNQAVFIPNAQKYNENDVTQGINLKDENGANSGVMQKVPVTIFSDVATGSYKEVKEVGNETNYGISANAAKDGQTDHILLQNKSSTINYTLNVQNADNIVMDKFIVIDNLPEIGDHSTLRDTLSRNSEFKVSLAEEPNFTVTVGDNAVTNFTVTYSSKTGSFDHTEDWQKGTGWSETKDGSTRSFRLEIKDEIPEGALVKISFNAKIDGVAKPGQLAWNSFGYEYHYTSGDVSTWLYAAPLNVGVGIPSAPKLVKKLVNSMDFGVSENEDKTFKFVIYKGDAVNFDDYSETGIGSSLSGIDFTYAELIVPKGKSVSEELVLDGQSGTLYKYSYNGSFNKTDGLWKWDDGAKYNIVEVEPEYGEYCFGYINNTVDRQRNYTFTYNQFKNISVTFANVRDDWKLKIVKTDVDDGKTLSGAVFGVYSANSSCALNETDISELKRRYNITHIEASAEVDGVKYYLAYYGESGSDGVINIGGLCDDVYIVKELVSPVGYNTREDNFIAKASEINSDSIYVLNITNERGVVLPETGGSGFGGVCSLLGGFIALAAAMLLAIKLKRAMGQ